MNLADNLAQRGYRFRQHVEEVVWTARKPTVVDLNKAQREALDRRGMEGLREVTEREGTWTFPAMDIAQPRVRRPDALLARQGAAAATIVAPDDDRESDALARALARVVSDRHGIDLPIETDRQARIDLLDRGDVILVGGAHRNRLTLELALRHQTLFADAAVPGDDGWMAAVLTGLRADGHNVVQIAAPVTHRDEVLELLLGRLEAAEGALWLRHVHRVEPGSVMRAHLPSWAGFIAGLHRYGPHMVTLDHVDPDDIPALADLLRAGLDSGGVEKNLYNSGPIHAAIACARYYDVCGDPRALRLFREILLRLGDYYLGTPGGASYPSDLDFPLGALILHFGRLEHADVFTDEDRLFLENLLLSCARSVYEYATTRWPVTCGDPTRHNHQTFPALSLAHAAGYFGPLGIADADRWQAYSSAVFSGPAWQRTKQRENASLYESFAPSHGAQYRAFTGGDSQAVLTEPVLAIARRMITATDNFFRAVDYGDSRPSAAPFDPMIARFAALSSDPLLRGYAAEGFRRKPRYVFNCLDGFPGIRQEGAAAPPIEAGWDCRPLDPLFAAHHAPGFPAQLAFDKLAFRTGWRDDDMYLLVEGVGNLDVSHAHLENNGLLRLNHLGRHWIVSNGYGRKVGLSNVSESFSTRIRGPEDHNMLVLTRGGEIVRELPCCNARLQCGANGRLLHFTGALLKYGGVDWFRTIILWAGAYTLVLDRIRVIDPGLERAHIEWNGVGRVSAIEQGFRLHQAGAVMDIASVSGWSARQGVSDRSACWKAYLSGEYPHAEFPLAKVVFHMPGTQPGETYSLATLLTAAKAAPAFRIIEHVPGRIRIRGPHGGTARIEVEEGDLRLAVDGDTCDIRFDPVPPLPSPFAPGL